MTRYFFIIISTIMLQLFPAGEGLAMEGIVVKIIDGDSMKIRVDGVVKEVRLYGIDTPEYKQPHSNKAKQFTKRMVDRQLVTVIEKDIDRYGRIVAVVVKRGTIVNMELVREGLAWFYPRYCNEQPLCNEMKQLEETARTARRGLWKDKDPVAPWDWKRQKKISRPNELRKWVDRLLSWL